MAESGSKESSFFSASEAPKSDVSLTNFSQSVETSSQPISIRIGSLLSPALFWAMEVPLAEDKSVLDTSSGSKKRSGGGGGGKSVIAKLAEVESNLARLYHKPYAEIKPAGAIPDPRDNMHVALRLRHNSPYWYRGQIRMVISSRSGPKVRVFLIDYGEVTEPLPARSCIRVLPKKFLLALRPMAFQVALAGLRPLAYNIDYDIGMNRMGYMVTSKYSAVALEKIRKLISATGHHWAIVRDWKKDIHGRVHGNIELQGYQDGPVDLAKVLIDGNFAIFDKQTFYSDIKQRPFPHQTSFLSICGSGIADGSQSFDESVNFSEADLTTWPKIVDEIEKLEVRSQCGSEDGSSSIVSGMDLGKRSLRESEQWLKPVAGSLSSAPGESSSTIKEDQKQRESAGGGAESDVSTGSARERILRMKKKLSAAQKAEKAVENVWERLRSQDDMFLATGDGLPSSSSSKPNANLTVPAGMDTGKYIEEALRLQGVYDGIGPKKIRPIP